MFCFHFQYFLWKQVLVLPYNLELLSFLMSVSLFNLKLTNSWIMPLSIQHFFSSNLFFCIHSHNRNTLFFLGTCCPIYFVDNLVPSRNRYILCNLQVISYMRGPLLFIFNFHPTDSYEQYNVGVEEAGEYQVSVIFL